jgi:hypothetical protein
MFIGEDRKSRSSDYFFCNGITRFNFALHMMSFPYCMFLLYKKYIYIFGENLQDFLFFSCHIRDCMCFHLMSQFFVY